MVKETWKKNKDQNVGEIQPAKEGMLMLRKACIERRQKRGKIMLRVQIYIAAQLCPEKATGLGVRILGRKVQHLMKR